MKCDELKPLLYSLKDFAYVDELAVQKDFENPHDHAVYKATEVDTAIEELKTVHHKERHEYINIIAELKQKLQDQCISCPVKMQEDDVIAEKDNEIRRLKRALWLARADRAEARKNYWHARSIHEGDNRLWSIDGSAVKYIGCIKRTNFEWLKIWCEVEIKCRAKAEVYK